MKKILVLAVMFAASQAFAGAQADLEKSAGRGGFKSQALLEAQADVLAPKLGKAAPIPADVLLSDEEKKALAQVQGIIKAGGAVSAESRVFLDKWFQKFLEAGLVGRAPSVYEIKQTVSWFPNLYENKWWRVTGEACGTYNCIAWSVGVTNKWLWPGDNQTIFDKFYLSYGYVPLGVGEDPSRAEVAYWETRGGASTHGCRRVAGDVWESKLGSSLRILHALKDLEGSTYGYVAKYYRKATTKELEALGVDPKKVKIASASLMMGAPACGAVRMEMTRGGAYDMGSPYSGQ